MPSDEPARSLRQSLLAGVTPTEGDEAALRACAAAGVAVKVYASALPTLTTRAPSGAPPAWQGVICVKTLTGKDITLPARSDLTVDDVKLLVQEAEGACSRP
jgi:hypothetical protein